MTTKFMTEHQKLELISEALCFTNKRLSENGSDIKVYELVNMQLMYIKECLLDTTVSRNRLHDINLGHIAITKLDGDVEYASLLKKVYFVVSYMKRGLKVPLLDEDGNCID
ncbi:immunity protein Tsi6 family protein [Vibrio owensii]|uniref:immunity protein Tsi6 family protein n=1 Tax=Vibrio owensii TaxID=696485 RepID=UPI002220B0FB|nr:immunity protein Tsi6 family protein [Vibrio owensii]